MATPTIIDKWLHVTQDGYAGVIRYSSRTMAPKAIFIHIQEGNTWGSWQHFHTVTASSTVLLGKNGDIWRLVPEDKAPWTNGDVQSPTAKGLALINRYGPDPNRYALTIECEGFTGEPVPEAQMNSLVWQVQDWQKRYGLTNADLYRHADGNSVTRPRCPGDALFNELMRRLSATPEPAPAPTPEYPAPLHIPQADGSDPVVMLDNGAVLILAPLTVEAVNDTARLQTAWAGGKPIGPKIGKGEQFAVRRLIINADKSMYWYTKFATRVRYEDTKIIGLG